MTRIALAGLALLAAVAASGCPPKPAAPVAPPTEQTAAVKAVVEQWRQAYEGRSMDTLARLYVHEPSLAIVQDGALQQGWAAIEPALRNRLAHATQIRIRIKDLEIASLGPGAAVAVGTMSRESSDGVTTVNENGVITLVLREAPEGWAIASEHYSYRRTGATAVP